MKIKLPQHDLILTMPDTTLVIKGVYEPEEKS